MSLVSAPLNSEKCTHAEIRESSHFGTSSYKTTALLDRARHQSVFEMNQMIEEFQTSLGFFF